MIPLAPILGVFGKVPIWAWALIALTAWGGYHRWRAIDARADFKAAQVQAQLEQAAQKTMDDAETARRTQTIMEAADAATIQSTANRADADRARVALERVRRELAAHQAQPGPAGAASATSGQTAGAAEFVPAELLYRCGARILGLATYADSARTAGRACERSYDSLTTTTGD